MWLKARAGHSSDTIVDVSTPASALRAAPSAVRNLCWSLRFAAALTIPLLGAGAALGQAFVVLVTVVLAAAVVVGFRVASRASGPAAVQVAVPTVLITGQLLVVAAWGLIH